VENGNARQQIRSLRKITGHCIFAQVATGGGFERRRNVCVCSFDRGHR
jgi:hypothetical protein